MATCTTVIKRQRAGKWFCDKLKIAARTGHTLAVGNDDAGKPHSLEEQMVSGVFSNEVVQIWLLHMCRKKYCLDR